MSYTNGNMCMKSGRSCIYANIAGGCGMTECVHNRGWVCNDNSNVCEHAKPNGDCKLDGCIHLKRHDVEITFQELEKVCKPVIDFLKMKKVDPYLSIEITLDDIKVRRTEMSSLNSQE